VHLKSIFLVVALLLCSATAQAQDASSPNIVMILVDDSALMDFGVYGGEAQTPNIDALAARGAMSISHIAAVLADAGHAPDRT